jgi:TolB-like protein
MTDLASNRRELVPPSGRPYYVGMSHRLLVAATLILGPLAAHAQCPNGAPPPCRSASTQPASRAPRPVDPTRIAILPFRITTSDSLLGEGFAELLATEFADEQGPRAVDMATVISAWQRAGGGLRTPLPRDKALALARDLGAGLLIEGSIVGLGRQITVTTNLVSSANGIARGSAMRVSTPADSIDSALRQTASGLVAALGGQQRTLEGARYTESPDAMRFYLQGISAWRRGRLLEAQGLLERAMTIDTTFAQAAFRRYLTSGWGVGQGTISNNEAARRAFALRGRLSPAERMLLETHLGRRYPAAVTPMSQRVNDQDRAAQLLPDSPEAQFFAGDVWYHWGASVDPVMQFEKAREYMERSLAIDTSATAVRHLIEVAIRRHDSAGLRRLLVAYERMEVDGRWPALYTGYSILGDDAQLARLRTRPQADTTLASLWPLFTALTADITAARLDAVVRVWNETLRDSRLRGELYGTYGFVLASRGRPAAAERAWASMVPSGGRDVGTERDRLTFELVDMGAGLDAEGAVTRLTQMSPNARGVQLSCEMIVLRLKRGTAMASDSAQGFGTGGTCGRSIEILKIPLDLGDSTIKLLQVADDATRNGLSGTVGYEAWLLARAWEKVGRERAAFNAIRYRSPGNFWSEATWLYGEEARLALKAADTTGAIRALETYLPILSDAEPPYAAKRDSLRALLAFLKGR